MWRTFEGVSSDAVTSLAPVYQRSEASERGNIIRVAFVVAWVAFLTFTRAGFSAGSMGEWIGTLIIPFVLAYLISRGWHKANRVSFSYWFLGLGLLLPSLAQHNRLSNLSHKDLVQELTGTKNLDQGLSRSDLEMATASRDFFREVKDWRKTHEDAVAVLVPKLAKLYTSESFSSKTAMENARQAVEQQQALDADTSKMFEMWPHSMRARLDKTNLSTATKEKYLKGFTESFSNSEYLAARKSTIPIEDEWAALTLDLYDFSLEHASQIVVLKNAVKIGNDVVRLQFNSKLANAEKLHDDLLVASRKAEDIRAAKMKKDGVSPVDIGLEK
ncbi:MAG: hypothetical protein JWM43_3639 [Acidobacteriaceae bacterium]|nr:hypothetical protein [Acidobacteriaceae bacterium]